MNHLTTINSAPKYTTNVQNGLPAVLFDGIDDACLGANKADIAQPTTQFIVFKGTGWSTGTYQIICEMIASSQNFAKYTGNTTLRLYAGTALVGASLSSNTTYLLTGIFNGTSSSVEVNNGAYIGGNAGTGTNTMYPIIGAGTTYAYPFTGYVMEWLVYTGNLSEADRTTCRTYLNTKWAIY
jgi:hypothetical protein